MKNLVFGLIATVMFSVSGFAKNANSSILDNLVKIAYIYNGKTVTLEKIVSNEIEANLFIDSELEKINTVLKFADAGDICSITVSVGSGSTFISGTITGDCDGIVVRAAKLKAQLMAIL